MTTLNGETKITRTYFLYPLERSPDALSVEEYEHRFLQAIAESFRAFRVDHVPLPDIVFKDTKVARRFFGIERMLHSIFAKLFPSYLMNVAASCPYQDVRQDILKDCWDEEVADPDAQGVPHIEVLYRDVEAMGIARDEVENFEPTPVLMACMHALDNLTRTLPWQGGYASMGGLEAARVAVARGYMRKDEDAIAASHKGRSVEDLCGLPEGSIKLWRLHASKDLTHGDDCLKVLKKYCTTREIQELTFWAVKTARSFRVVTNREQRRIAMAAIGLPADSLIVT
ncbi:MAG TPA: iron-containing redox enzyme family protein [Candidatus Binatia bacterium]